MTTIHSLSEFIDELADIQRVGENLGPPFWFRGHANRSWTLLPGVLRDEFSSRVDKLRANSGKNGTLDESVEATEKLINNQFRRQGSSMLPPEADTTDIYFFAQHYGLPTRLLDWTANPLAALFFASALNLDEDGEVVGIRPDWSLTFGDDPPDDDLPEPPLDQRHDLVVRSIDYLFDLDDRPDAGLIIPIQPDLRTARMLQQGACFTLHMPGCPEIKSGGEHCRRFTVPAERKESLARELRALGINWATLFPDLDHLAREIGEQWKLRREVN